MVVLGLVVLPVLLVLAVLVVRFLLVAVLLLAAWVAESSSHRVSKVRSPTSAVLQVVHPSVDGIPPVFSRRSHASLELQLRSLRFRFMGR